MSVSPHRRVSRIRASKNAVLRLVRIAKRDMEERTKHDEPLGLLDTVGVGLGVTEGGNVDLVGLFDLRLGTVTDEDGLATPLDDDL